MAQSLLTYHRRIPFPAEENGKSVNYHWTQVLPLYEKELADFQSYVKDLENGKADKTVRFSEKELQPLKNADFKLLSNNAEIYPIKIGERIFSDANYIITDIAPELIGLQGIRFSNAQAQKTSMTLRIQANEPLRILVGYFKSGDPKWLQVPNPEIDARANERAGFAPVIRNAAIISQLPGVNIHAFRYEKGEHELEMIGQGSYIILGAVPENIRIVHRDAKRMSRF